MTTGDELLGKRLGAYQIESRLGSGATGVVYRAKHPGFRQPMALKVLHDNLGSISGLQRRFEREARVLKKLAHPNIVEITDFGMDGRYTFIAMEMLRGKTLEEHLQQSAMSPERVIQIFDPVLDALGFAHEQEIVHRDLKPANVFQLDDGGVKLLDFGLAKMLSFDPEEAEEGTLTRKGRIVGTPAYMAPEQITGVSLDARADVYAMGIMLYEMLADRRPFVYERRSELLRAHLLEPVPPIMETRAGLWVSDDLRALIDVALTKDPDDRFPNARAMLAALRALPREAATLDSTAVRIAERRRRSAKSEIISDTERRAITESAHATTGETTVYVRMPMADLADMAETETGLTGLPRPRPAGMAAAALEGRSERDRPTLRPTKSPFADGSPPTAVLFLISAVLLALSIGLWVGLM